MIHKKIDDKGRITLGPNLMRILGVKPGDTIDFRDLYDGSSVLLVEKVITITKEDTDNE